jgi:tetratricopeptide (TPR) repeat protein
MGNLANMYSVAGRFAEAEQLLRQTLEIELRTLGPQHSDTLASLDVLGLTLKYEKRYAESEKIYRETLERRRRALGVEHPDLATTAYDFACVLALEGKRDEALSNLQISVEHALNAEKRRNLEKDADFDSLRGDSRFEALVAYSRQRAAAMH